MTIQINIANANANNTNTNNTTADFNALFLTIGGKRHQFRTYEDAGFNSMYRCQDLMKAYGLKGREVSNRLAYIFDTEKFSNALKVSGGKKDNQGTYLHQEEFLAFAAKIDPTFAKAVTKAFSLLTEGEVTEAAKVVNAVSISQKAISEATEVSKLVNEAICNWSISQSIPLQQAQPRIWGSIICSRLTGIKSVKTLKQYMDVKSVADLFQSNEAFYEHIGGFIMLGYDVAAQLNAGINWDTLCLIHGRNDILADREKRHKLREEKAKLEQDAEQEAKDFEF